MRLAPTTTVSRKTCGHTGAHTPIGLYSREACEIRYVTVCDNCGAQVGEIDRVSYEPNFDPTGNDAFASHPT
jgi:hypothetical protein